jgi:biotin synthase
MDYDILLENIYKKLDREIEIEKEEAIALIDMPNEKRLLEKLYETASFIHKRNNKNKVNLCSIISGKQGNCSEDCKFCAQSSKYDTETLSHGLLNYNEIEKFAKEASENRISRFSIVTSGKRLDKKDFSSVLNYYETINNKIDISLCASHGTLDYEDFIKLKKSGVKMYHHNLETSKNHYKNICSTHSYEERIETIKSAKRAGLKICSGGIIGMGESTEDRIDMIYDLKRLEVDSVPINILTPISGTPFEALNPISNEEILNTIAVYRIVMPKVEIRYGAGRAYLGKLQLKGFEIGINGMITGNYLTTTGSNIAEDKEMLKKEKLRSY